MDQPGQIRGKRRERGKIKTRMQSLPTQQSLQDRLQHLPHTERGDAVIKLSLKILCESQLITRLPPNSFV